MFLVADSAFLSRISYNVKIMLKANVIGTLSDKLQCFVIAVPAYPVKIIRTNSNMIMTMICVAVGTDDYRSVLTENFFRSFNTYAMCFFGRNGAVKGLRI